MSQLKPKEVKFFDTQIKDTISSTNNTENNKSNLKPKTSQPKDILNISNVSKDVGMIDIMDQIGNLMKKFAVEEDLDKKEQLKNNRDNQFNFYEDEQNDKHYIYQPKGEKFKNNLNLAPTVEENTDNTYYIKEMNLYNNLQKRLDKLRKKNDLAIVGEKWKMSENSRKIVSSKLQEKPIYERALEIAEIQKMNKEKIIKENEIEKEKVNTNIQTKWNQGYIDEEVFQGFIDKQKNWNLMKDTKNTMLKEKLEKIENEAIKSTLFKPKILTKSRSLAKNQNQEKVHDRLYKYTDELKIKKEELEKKNKPSFAPQINNRIPKYLKIKNNNNQFNKNEINNNLDDQYNNDFLKEINNENIRNSEDYTKKNINYLEEKKDLIKNSNINRRQSAPNEKNISENNVSFSSQRKNNIKNNFDLKGNGILNDFNNVNHGENFKNIINNNSIKNLRNAFILNQNINNNQINSNLKINESKKLNDRLPIQKFSIPVSNIKIDNLLINNSKENEKINLKNKRLSTSVIENNNNEDFFKKRLNNDVPNLKKNSIDLSEPFINIRRMSFNEDDSFVLDGNKIPKNNSDNLTRIKLNQNNIRNNENVLNMMDENSFISRKSSKFLDDNKDYEFSNRLIVNNNTAFSNKNIGIVSSKNKYN